jgi:hypothetical protein
VRRSSRTWRVGLAGVCLVIGGCSGGEDPVRGLTSTASATSSPSTTAPTTRAASDIPAAARAHTPAGAEAFVKYFYDKINIAWTTPATGILPPLSDPGCRACRAFETSAKALVGKGQRYASDPVTITNIRAVPGGSHGQQYVVARLEQHSVSVVDSAGREVSRDEEKSASTTISLVWTEGGWHFYDSI